MYLFYDLLWLLSVLIRDIRGMYFLVHFSAFRGHPSAAGKSIRGKHSREAGIPELAAVLIKLIIFLYH